MSLYLLSEDEIQGLADGSLSLGDVMTLGNRAITTVSGHDLGDDISDDMIKECIKGISSLNCPSCLKAVVDCIKVNREDE